MQISDLATAVSKQAKIHTPEILTALGITGVVSTSYLAGKAAFKAAAVIDEDERVGGTADDRRERFKQRARLTWKLYIPAVLSGVSTAACIAGASRASGRRTAAAVTAFTVTEKALSDYKEKVFEQVGKNTEQKLRDTIAKEKVDANPPSKAGIFMVGNKHIVHCELYTGRYFMSDRELLLRAQNEINQRIYNDMYVMLSEFYDLIGIPHTSQSDYVGWDSGRPMELGFSPIIAEETGEPCVAFEYNYVKPLR